MTLLYTTHPGVVLAFGFVLGQCVTLAAISIRQRRWRASELAQALDGDAPPVGDP